MRLARAVLDDAVAREDENAAVWQLVTVGYQRPTVMSGPRMYVLSSSRRSSCRPCPRSAAMWPPAISVLPSASCVWPEQKRFRVYGTAMNVAGRGPRVSPTSGAASQPSQASTCPVGSSDMLTATKGHGVGALHSPTWSGVARLAAREPPSIINAPARTHNASARRCQRGIAPRARRVYEAVVRTVKGGGDSAEPLYRARVAQRQRPQGQAWPSRLSSVVAAPRRPSCRAPLQLAADSRQEPQIAPRRPWPARLHERPLPRRSEPGRRQRRHEDELEPESAEHGCRQDVANSRHRAGGQQRAPDVLVRRSAAQKQQRAEPRAK